MKNKKSRIISFSLAAIAFFSPVFALVSCGGKSYNDVVLIKTTWASSGSQYKSMETIVKKYNDSKSPDSKEVVLQHVEGGYGSIASLESKDINMKKLDNVSNIFIDYPSSIAKLSKYGVEMDLYSDDNLKREDFVNSFLDVNDSIEGIKNSTKGKSMFYAPLATSTEMIAANLPVLKNVLKNIVSHGGSVKGLNQDGSVNTNILISDKILSKAIKYIGEDEEIGIKNFATDDNFVNKIWKNPENKTTFFNDFTVDETTFESYEKILDFSEKVKTFYDESPSNPSTEKYVLGIDSPSNLILQADFGVSDFSFDKSKFLYGLNSNSEGEYEGLKNVDSNQSANFKKTLKIFENSVKNYSTVFQKNGAFTSSDLTNHRTIFSWGSTAGYSHNFNGSMSEIPNFKDIKLSSYRKKITSKTEENSSEKYTKAIAITDDEYKNPIYDINDLPSDFETNTQLYKYSLVVSNEVATKIKNDLKNSITKNSMFMDSSQNLEGKKGATLAYSYEDSNGEEYKYFYLDPSSITFNEGGDSETLQLEEVAFSTAPSKIYSTDESKTNILQGPSFIPVKHNSSIDKETIKFIKWFYNEESKIEEGQEEISIVDYFLKKSSYIVPVSNAFEIKNKDKYSKGNSIVFETFKNFSEDNEGEKSIFAFQAPITRYSINLRKNIDSAASSFWTNSVKINEFKPAEKVYEKIVQLSKSDGFI